MPHGCSLSLHETSGNKMHMPHELTPKWIGLKCPDTFISTAQRVCETCSKVAGGVGQMSATCQKEPMARKVSGFSSKYLQLLS